MTLLLNYKNKNEKGQAKFHFLNSINTIYFCCKGNDALLKRSVLYFASMNDCINNSARMQLVRFVTFVPFILARQYYTKLKKTLTVLYGRGRPTERGGRAPLPERETQVWHSPTGVGPFNRTQTSVNRPEQHLHKWTTARTVSLPPLPPSRTDPARGWHAQRGTVEARLI